MTKARSPVPHTGERAFPFPSRLPGAGVRRRYADAMPTRQQQKAETRSAILHAAATEFATQGFAAATFSSIAARMGRPKSALSYYQFRSKDEMACAIVEEQFAVWERFHAAALAQAPAGLPRLLSLLLTTALDTRSGPYGGATVRLLLERTRRGIDLPEPPFDWTAFIRGEVEEAVASGQLPPSSSVQEVADMITSTSFGVYEADNQGLRPVDLRVELPQMWRKLLTGLGARDADGLISAVVDLSTEPS